MNKNEGKYLVKKIIELIYFSPPFQILLEPQN